MISVINFFFPELDNGDICVKLENFTCNWWHEILYRYFEENLLFWTLNMFNKDRLKNVDLFDDSVNPYSQST